MKSHAHRPTNRPSLPDALGFLALVAMGFVMVFGLFLGGKV